MYRLRIVIVSLMKFVVTIQITIDPDEYSKDCTKAAAIDIARAILRGHADMPEKANLKIEAAKK